MDSILIINAIVLWVVVITNFLITLVLVRRLTELLELARGAQRPEMIKVGEKAPQMKLVNLTGSIVTDTQLIGREVAMVFVSPGCQPCRNVMPELETLYWRTKDIGVEMMVVSLTDSDATQNFINEVGFDAPVYTPPDNIAFSDDFQIQSTPSFYLLNQRWEIAAAGRLGREWDKLKDSWNSKSATATNNM